jgi:hypothetical protein
LAGKRTAELVQRYVDLLGGGPLSIDTQAQVLSAAELQILAEQARFAALESETPPDYGTLEQIVRVHRLANAALRRIGLDHIKREDPHEMTLAQYLDAKTRKGEAQP